MISAFLAASRNGDFDALVALLDPDALLRADEAAVRMGSTAEERGSAPVARIFSGRAAAAELALIDGVVGAAWAPGGKPRVVFAFTFSHDGSIVGIDLLAEPVRHGQMALTLLGQE